MKTRRIYQEFEELPEDCRPAWVVRENGAALVTFDPRSTRREAVAWSVANLTRHEINLMRAAHGVPPVDQPCPDDWLEDRPVDTYVPISLRLPGAIPHTRYPEERTA